MKCHLLDTNLFQPCGQFIQKDCGVEVEQITKRGINENMN